VTKTNKLIRRGRREGRREARREEREELRKETGHRFPKLRKAASFMWNLAKKIPFRPFGGTVMSAGEIFDDFIEGKKNDQ
jgi:hypothetical protein